MARPRDSGEAWDDGRAERLNRIESGITKAEARYEALSDEQREALGAWVDEHPDRTETIGQGEPRRDPVDRSVGGSRTAAAPCAWSSAPPTSPPARPTTSTTSSETRTTIRPLLPRGYIAAVTDPLYASAF